MYPPQGLLFKIYFYSKIKFVRPILHEVGNQFVCFVFTKTFCLMSSSGFFGMTKRPERKANISLPTIKVKNARTFCDIMCFHNLALLSRKITFTFTLPSGLFKAFSFLHCYGTWSLTLREELRTV
jgi:hypothetical protein